MQKRRLVLLTGQEATGKSTVVRALLPRTPSGAQLDAEDVGQVNPWVYDAAFTELHLRNATAVALNFWKAGYRTVLVGSLVNTHVEYLEFRRRLPEDVDVLVVQLTASRAVRNQRRLGRGKRSDQQWHDLVDRNDPEDTTLAAAAGDYRYVCVDTGSLRLEEALRQIMAAAPEIWPR
ncbi:hypothetical protein SAMN05661080_01146 [Modestobacter sp. DSM 44400]|uniref:hypothetical protein n=1 Tax=Modestobacter sp. DSM 44400 TaxID=1550230 RepID=UPI000894D88B|nr:hypothetical protein [Modestobacter sp. DSM 44400]SDX76862.1 hypothetical protein SAMN05661080_01146 [Modestobacter sp. DSM 44400]